MGEEENGLKHQETSYCRFERSIMLPEGVKTEEIKANYRNGALELTMPACARGGRSQDTG
jgi:HSP20 family protein